MENSNNSESQPPSEPSPSQPQPQPDPPQPQEQPEQEPEELEEPSEPETLNWPSHMSIVGLPRTGKTTLASDLLKRLSKVSGCLFVNLQAEPYFEDFMTVRRVDIAALLAGQSFVWNADPWEVRRKLVEIFLAQRACKTLNPITIFVDEAHLVAPRGCFAFPESGEITEDCIIGVLCTTGLKWNVRMVWISQRPQFVDSGVYRTSRFHVFFTVDATDLAYFRQQGIVFENPEWHDYVVVRS